MFAFNYSFGRCDRYITDGSGKEQEVTAIIGPLAIREFKREDESKTFDIIVGCSLSFSCESLQCHYSKLSREKRREQRQEEKLTRHFKGPG